MPDLRTDPSGAARTAAVSSSEIVESFLAALHANDLEHALTLVSDDVVYQNVPFPADRGKAQVERTLRAMMRVVKEFDVVMHHIAEHDGIVLTERTDSLRGPWLELAFWVCGTFEVRDGRIVLWRDRFDLATLALQTITSPLRRLLRARTPASGH